MLNLLFAVFAAAGTPSDRAVHAALGVPITADTLVVKTKTADGLVLPLPHVGFVPVPVAVWKCDLYRHLPNAPAGAPPVWWGSVRVVGVK